MLLDRNPEHDITLRSTVALSKVTPCPKKSAPDMQERCVIVAPQVRQNVFLSAKRLSRRTWPFMHSQEVNTFHLDIFIAGYVQHSMPSD